MVRVRRHESISVEFTNQHGEHVVMNKLDRVRGVAHIYHTPAPSRALAHQSLAPLAWVSVGRVGASAARDRSSRRYSGGRSRHRRQRHRPATRLRTAPRHVRCLGRLHHPTNDRTCEGMSHASRCAICLVQPLSLSRSLSLLVHHPITQSPNQSGAVVLNERSLSQEKNECTL